MVNFKSIIVFDSETTSLPCIDHNTTKIIELAFLGCEIEHFKHSMNIPRVLHKLVLCINPRKMIHPDASKTSGLENELLENLQPFRVEDATMLKHFISRLPSPVCILAHNGHKFDFPILKRALKALNQTLPNNVYCADSLDGFRFFYPKAKSQTLNTSNSQGDKQVNQESTPESQKTIPANTVNYKSSSHEFVRNLITPEVCRELFPEIIEVPLSGREVTKCSTPRQSTRQLFDKKPRSHKLKDIYYFLHRRHFTNGHRAENDCEALLNCIIKCEEFLGWMSKNAVVFNSVESLF